MAVTKSDFTATVDNWVQALPSRMTQVFRASCQEVIKEMQKVGPSVASTKADIKASGNKMGPVTAAGEGGNMPVDTGFLRASLQVTINEGPVPANRPNPNPQGKYTYSSTAASAIIAGAEIGDTVYATYSAAYAPMAEWGTSKMRGYGFVRLAVAQWPEIVRIQTVRAKNVALDGFARLSE